MGMINREKVIKGLELCRYDPDAGQENKWYHSCLKCPYCWSGPETEMFTTRDCWRLFSDAIDLLKEQEPKTGKWILDDENANSWECSECGGLTVINYGTPHENNWYFCPCCGAKLEEQVMKME